MSVGRFLQQAAAGAGGGDPVYAEDVFSTNLYEGNNYSQGINTGLLLGDGLSGGEATYFNWDTFLTSSATASSGASSYTVSMYIKGDANTVVQRPFSISGFATFTLSNDRLDFASNRQDGNGAAISWFFQHAGKFFSGRWNHILFSVSNNGSKYCYINDQQATPFAGAVYSTSPMYGIDPIVGGSSASSPTAGNTFNGSLARIYVKKEYVDLSVTSNRRIFVNADLTPVSHSSLVARNPELYMPLGSNHTENLGTESHSFTTQGDGTPELTTGVDSTVTGEGGLVWIRQRDTARNYMMVDTTRGVNQTLNSDRANAVQNTINSVTNFNPEGFAVGSEASVNEYNGPFVSWAFRKAPGFFDIVTYTGNGTTQTINHSLGSVPGMIIVKSTSGSYDWAVYHRGLNGGTNSEQYGLYLNTTQAQQDNDTLWNDTAPTSTQFSVGKSSGAAASTNANGVTYVAYLFAHDAQDFGADEDEAIIKCGAYTGTSSSNYPVEVDLGFEPQWILVRDRSNASTDWHVVDNMRGMSVDRNNNTATYLRANTTGVESINSTGNSSLMPTATGFNVLGTGNAFNRNGANFIYVAIRRPHKPAENLKATDLLTVGSYVGNGSTQDEGMRFGMDPDMFMVKNVDQTGNMYVHSRLMGHVTTDASITLKGLITHLQNSEYDVASYASPDETGRNISVVQNSSYNLSVGAKDYIYYGLRRAPGFFDAVAYKGEDLSSGVLKHSLGVKPELVIIKQRTQSRHWAVGAPDILGINANTLSLNNNYANGTLNYNMFDTTVGQTATQIKLHGNEGGISSNSQEYIAFLFATSSGISKVGTYTGSGSAQTIDCGFSNGARFVLIKCTSGSANWYLWDSERGITSGLDNYIVVNQTAAQTTNSPVDVNPASSGFEVFGNDSDSNRNSETYLFLAIA